MITVQDIIDNKYKSCARLILGCWDLLVKVVRTDIDRIEDLPYEDEIQHAEGVLREYDLKCPFDAQFGR